MPMKMSYNEAEQTSNEITARLMTMCMPHATVTTARTTARSLVKSTDTPTPAFPLKIDSPNESLCHFKR
mgnify:CR=1 FL=1